MAEPCVRRATRKLSSRVKLSNGNLANVQTKIVSSSGEFPIDYRMLVSNGQWKVYDMVIENVSVVNNYRAQFERVIARSSVKELLAMMKQPGVLIACLIRCIYLFLYKAPIESSRRVGSRIEL